MAKVKIVRQHHRPIRVEVDGHVIPVTDVQLHLRADKPMMAVLTVPAFDLILEDVAESTINKMREGKGYAPLGLQDLVCGLRSILESGVKETWCGVLRAQEGITSTSEDVTCPDCRAMMANKTKWLTVHAAHQGSTLCGYPLDSMPAGDRWTHREEFVKDILDWSFDSDPIDGETRKCRGCVERLSLEKVSS